MHEEHKRTSDAYVSAPTGIRSGASLVSYGHDNTSVVLVRAVSLSEGKKRVNLRL